MADTPRMYTRVRALPVDVIDPDHEDIHGELDTWGRWNRERRAKLSCGSLEKEYRPSHRSWHYPTAAEMMPRNIVNPRMRLVERAVLRLPEQHRDTVRRYYIFQQRPEIICRHANIRYSDFQRWMRDCRNMVLNQLRFLGA